MEKLLKARKIDPKFAQAFLAEYGTQITVEQASSMLVLLEKLSKLALEAVLAQPPHQERSPSGAMVKP
ncbi:hypothetical protein [Pedobacter paludis]|uniref:Uncharacterized protein n=1 Tax=Pedobacter paludis TaxID=2203212 RepID=A0A317EUY3_9SPHI|nr:hypothetical protein [Pedobacter paludis]PWS30265.1 hypothetical protein DF947_17675 [Pedobacter paludis]